MMNYCRGFIFTVPNVTPYSLCKQKNLCCNSQSLAKFRHFKIRFETFIFYPGFNLYKNPKDSIAKACKKRRFLNNLFFAPFRLPHNFIPKNSFQSHSRAMTRTMTCRSGFRIFFFSKNSSEMKWFSSLCELLSTIKLNCGFILAFKICLNLFKIQTLNPSLEISWRESLKLSFKKIPSGNFNFFFPFCLRFSSVFIFCKH